MSDPSGYDPVWETSDSALLPVIRSLLEASGIPVVVQGEEALGIFPVGGVGGTFSTFRKGITARVLVPRERREEAERLIRSRFVPADRDSRDEPDGEEDA